MNPEQFVYWFQGYTELTGGKEPTLDQWKMIRDHLRTVFTKVTPERDVKEEEKVDDDFDISNIPLDLSEEAMKQLIREIIKMRVKRSDFDTEKLEMGRLSPNLYC